MNLKTKIEQFRADVKIFSYGPIDEFGYIMNQTDIYIWLPVASLNAYRPEQMQVLSQWLEDKKGRQVHFHWADGTRLANSNNAPHNSTYDSMYYHALLIDYQDLNNKQNELESILRNGSIRITTPEGTDISFTIGDRPVTKQNGDASLTAMKNARNHIDREIELPAGAIRVAPLEKTVSGILFVPSLVAMGEKVLNLRIEFKAGKIVKYTADSGTDSFRKLIQQQYALNYFREFGLGVNPALIIPPEYGYIPYYGYGAGMVRLSLGNNLELGGNVEGPGTYWLFFPKATVSANNKIIVKDGILVK